MDFDFSVKFLNSCEFDSIGKDDRAKAFFYKKRALILKQVENFQIRLCSRFQSNLGKDASLDF